MVTASRSGLVVSLQLDPHWCPLTSCQAHPNQEAGDPPWRSPRQTGVTLKLSPLLPLSGLQVPYPNQEGKDGPTRGPSQPSLGLGEPEPREERLSLAELREAAQDPRLLQPLSCQHGAFTPSHSRGREREGGALEHRAGHAANWAVGGSKGQTPLGLGPLTCRTGRWIQVQRPGVHHR